MGILYNPQKSKKKYESDHTETQPEQIFGVS